MKSYQKAKIFLSDESMVKGLSSYEKREIKNLMLPSLGCRKVTAPLERIPTGCDVITDVAFRQKLAAFTILLQFLYCNLH